MKIFLIVIIPILLSACSSPGLYYQLLSTSSDNVNLFEKEYVYENSDFKIIYNLWENHGNSGFQIFNKTDKNIFLNLEECQYTLNGIAYDYYLNRVFGEASTSSFLNHRSFSNAMSKKDELNLIKSTSIHSGTSSQITAKRSTEYIEKKVILVPPKSSRNIQEYSIRALSLRHCDLLKYPNYDEITVVRFSKEDSPVVFSNIITYSFDKDFSVQKKVTNLFWVSEISNIPQKQFIAYRPSTFCKEESRWRKLRFYINYSPQKFYIKYLEKEFEEFDY